MNVFVYGTLRTNQRYHEIIKNQVKSVHRAVITGQLYHLPFDYPALLEGNGKVFGELMTFYDPEKALEAMDELEGYYGPGANNEYDRVLCEAVTEDRKSHSCYVYVYKAHGLDWLKREAIQVPGGDWVHWKGEKA